MGRVFLSVPHGTVFIEDDGNITVKITISSKKMRRIRFQKANCYQYQAHLIQNSPRLKIVLFKK